MLVLCMKNLNTGTNVYPYNTTFSPSIVIHIIIYFAQLGEFYIIQKREKERKTKDIKRERKYMSCLASFVYSMLHIRSTSTSISRSTLLLYYIISFFLCFKLFISG